VLVLGLLAGLVVFASVSSASPGLKLDKKDIGGKQCKADGATSTPLVNVNFTVVNDSDSGFAGNEWANDTIDRQLQVWQLSDGTFCAQVADHGKFVTLAGASPSGASTVDAGVKGDLQGGYVTTFFTGTFAPTLPTHGNLGTFDLACTDANTCPGEANAPSVFNSTYFSSTTGADLAQWGWIYHAGKNGTWLNQDNVAAADSGDITG
jgi:hypothetical protein